MDRQARLMALVKKTAKKDLQVAPGDSLFDSGLMDSFALPDLVAAIETEFRIKIPDSDLNPRKFDSIERIETYLDSRG
jgi:D-alanine--poly(phosphoribitol) ligase subunit 2